MTFEEYDEHLMGMFNFALNEVRRRVLEAKQDADTAISDLKPLIAEINAFRGMKSKADLLPKKKT